MGRSVMSSSAHDGPACREPRAVEGVGIPPISRNRSPSRRSILGACTAIGAAAALGAVNLSRVGSAGALGGDGLQTAVARRGARGLGEQWPSQASLLSVWSSLTFDRQGKIVRWIDYWDGRSSLAHIPIGAFGPYPTDFRDNQGSAPSAIRHASEQLQSAFSAGDAASAVQSFTPDAVFEDMALHARVEGQLQIQRYLARGLGQLPYGTGASIANIVGSNRGGGYEWHAAQSAAPLLRGNTALELDSAGRISRFTTIYDSCQFPDSQYRILASLHAEI